jgi:hypothetical protein
MKDGDGPSGFVFCFRGTKEGDGSSAAIAFFFFLATTN